MRHPFELDPEIIHHIIYSQAGSVAKALIELIMNSVDAGASAVMLNITPEGFTCRDDGHGFTSYDDVKRYFGRFGTPHREGDATYGRFRLGRGQIMAHARTVWRSQRWQMEVDTRVMGYEYELTEPEKFQDGCAISGEWYEPLSTQERMSCIQEIRDLVRYTPVSVSLNGNVITRKPELEKWDAEDDMAWYRLREDGAVSIYNLGVLVRHDPGHQWGAGGIIVSKKAIALNVSRTEILRKSCTVWKQVAAKFGELAQAFSDNTGNHRKTEARREKTARALLAGEGDLQKLFHGEEVITLLPGRQHVTLEHFLRKCRYYPSSVNKNCFTIASAADDVPRGELIARQGIATVVHPVTLTRFNCHNIYDFMDCLSRVRENLTTFREQLPHDRRWGSNFSSELQLIDFRTLSASFIDHTQVMSEKSLDKETRRAWTALRFCLAQYARVCAGGERWGSVRATGGVRFQIFLGESTSAEAWTDGESYIAYNIDIVRQLKTDALRTASRLFSLTEHEVAHEGDSMDCGHDEAFYQRFHDISTKCAAERQHFMHVWLMKYTMSLEGAGKRAKGRAWQERYLAERVSTGREKKGLPGIITDDNLSEEINASAEPEDSNRLTFLNQLSGAQGKDVPAAVNWPDVVAEGIQVVISTREQWEERQRLDEAAWMASRTDDTGRDEDEDESDEQEYLESSRRRLLELLPGATPENLTVEIFEYLLYMTMTQEEELDAWQRRTWEQPGPYRPLVSPGVADSHTGAEAEETGVLISDIPEHWRHLVREGETRWMIKRNSAAAGILSERDYLEWRRDNGGDVS
ncbi:ATP-binding protein [Pantoea agglomerans]|uniref:ATP-binding protein n=1 Tax=Enterobacter agglomerans TaxID=549 RepID=A0AAN2FFK1_ENTAG|nr:ATP-binding protein [Pantoea agglomerans]CAH6334041.1 ATP-binding protein [Pantoea agglomerans]